MISVVRVYDSRKILDSSLRKSISKQTADYELILLDNTNRSFQSVAQAFMPTTYCISPLNNIWHFIHSQGQFEKEAGLNTSIKLFYPPTGGGEVQI